MKHKLKMCLITSISVLIVVLIVFIISRALSGELKKDFAKLTGSKSEEEETTVTDSFLLSDAIDRQFLTINPNSRPGTALKKVNAVVVHYVGNPGTTASQNRSYFEGLKDSKDPNAGASSHYIIGLEGEIIQCVPLEEISYASNNRNKDTVAIECCHEDATGKFNEKTYSSLVKLTAALLKTYGLSVETGLIRHYDVTKKECPLYYVKNEDEWYGFKLAVEAAMKAE